MALVSALLGQTSSAPKAETAAQAYKNIQVLRDSPADQLIPSMQFMSSSLGVHCEHCHVEGAFEKDDKKPKQQAREMMKMVFALNQNNFHGDKGITCYSCHRGALRPRRTPVVAEIGPKAPAVTPVTTSADDILNKYVQAIGGVAALQRVDSEVRKGTLELATGVQFPTEVYLKQPGLRSVVTHFPNGDSVEVENGEAGWSLVPGRPLHTMSKSEVEAARTEADPAFLANLRKSFSEFSVRPDSEIAGNKVSVLHASNPNQPPVRLYIDKQSGLLVRMVRYVDSPLGRNPTQIDYSDYRQVAGTMQPFRWTIAQPAAEAATGGN